MKPAFLLIGDGRVSGHLGRYFRLLGFKVQSWSRKQDSGNLAKMAGASSHILCLISDPAIEPFLRSNGFLFSKKTVLHASGSLVTPLAISAHPLMTFVDATPYELETYRSIPFIVEKGGPKFSELLPGLPNPSFEIDPALKPLYHAYCVMSGNFTVLLWQKTIAEFESRLGMPREALFPYLQQVSRNLQSNAATALSGPLAREDHKTIETHLRELDGDPFAQVYRAFVAAVAESKSVPAPNSSDTFATEKGGRL